MSVFSLVWLQKQVTPDSTIIFSSTKLSASIGLIYVKGRNMFPGSYNTSDTRKKDSKVNKTVNQKIIMALKYSIWYFKPSQLFCKMIWHCSNSIKYWSLFIICEYLYPSSYYRYLIKVGLGRVRLWKRASLG